MLSMSLSWKVYTHTHTPVTNSFPIISSVLQEPHVFSRFVLIFVVRTVLFIRRVFFSQEDVHKLRRLQIESGIYSNQSSSGHHHQLYGQNFT